MFRFIEQVLLVLMFLTKNNISLKNQPCITWLTVSSLNPDKYH